MTQNRLTIRFLKNQYTHYLINAILPVEEYPWTVYEKHPVFLQFCMILISMIQKYLYILQTL